MYLIILTLVLGKLMYNSTQCSSIQLVTVIAVIICHSPQHKLKELLVFSMDPYYSVCDTVWFDCCFANIEILFRLLSLF